jgi:hypothetical protein
MLNYITKLGIPEVQETTSGDVNCGTAFAKEEGQSGPGYYFIWSGGEHEFRAGVLIGFQGCGQV